MNIIAKKNNNKTQNLIQHTEGVLYEIKKLLKKKDIQLVSQLSGYNQNKIYDLIFFAGYFHDIGKVTEQFQNTIKNNSKSYHSLYSSALLSSIDEFKYVVDEDDDVYINLLSLAVLTHHSIFNKDSSFKEIAANSNKYIYDYFESEAESFFNNYKKEYKNFFDKECDYNFNFRISKINELAENISYDFDAVKDIRRKDLEKIRILYSYVSGILNLADWIASAKFSRTFTYNTFDKVLDKNYLLNKLEKALDLDKFIPKNFQDDLSNIKGNVLVEIPTGEGKTEGAYSWSINNLRDENTKIIYTLPTQTTSNKMYERVKKIFNSKTGLIHGASKNYLSKIYEIENGFSPDQIRSELLFMATFNKTFTVSTIDSLFKYFLNLGRYNITNLNYINSCIIIDEIHSFDFKMLGFIKRFIEISEKTNVPLCIMSASIPKVIKKQLGIENWKLIKDDKLFEKKANYLKKYDYVIEDSIEDIVNDFEKGKNVIVVKNTVKESVEIFNKIKNSMESKDMDETKIMLYNSRFKKCDRVKKEDEIYERLEKTDNFILVATQVIEISLDIDFDIMYTDNAPIDALIQRFGRVNRKKSKDKIGKINIYRYEKNKPYDSNILKVTYDILKDGLYDIAEYTEWLNKVYNQIFKTKKVINELESKFKEGYEIFNNNLEILWGISQSDDIYSLRDIEIPKMDFLLVDDYDNDNKSYENTISLECYYRDDIELCIAEKNIEHGLYYDVLNLEYDYETGAEYPEKNKASFDIM